MRWPALPGTHNTYNYRDATGLLLERPHNQVYSTRVQMQMLGVRNVELDPHFLETIPPANTTKFAAASQQARQAVNSSTAAVDRIRVCHMGKDSAALALSVCESAGWLVCNVFEVFDFGNDTGCGAVAPSLRDELLDIKLWLDNARGAEESVPLTIFIDDFLDGRIDLVDGLLRDLGLAERVFTPADFDAWSNTTTNRAAVVAAARSANRSTTEDDWVHYGNIANWPTGQQFQTQFPNKTLVLFIPASGTLSDYMFPNEARRSINFKGRFRAATCSNGLEGRIGRYTSLNFVQGDATLYSLLGLALDNSQGGADVIRAGDVGSIGECGFAAHTDLADVPLASGAVWTWAPEHPDLTQGACAVYKPVSLDSIVDVQFRDSGNPIVQQANESEVWSTWAGDYRLHSARCNATYRHACQRDQFHYDEHNVTSIRSRSIFNASRALMWSVSAAAGNGTNATCPAGYHFAVPHTAIEAAHLRKAMQAAGVVNVWVSYHSLASNSFGCWQIDGTGSAVCLNSSVASATCSSACTVYPPAVVTSTSLIAVEEENAGVTVGHEEDDSSSSLLPPRSLVGVAAALLAAVLLTVRRRCRHATTKQESR